MSGCVANVLSVKECVPADPPDRLVGIMEVILALVSILDFSISLARFFITSLVSLILLCEQRSA